MSEKRVPLVPLRDIVVFPRVVTPLFVGRPRSVSAIKAAISKEGATREILLTTQRNPRTKDPSADDLHSVGTLARIKSVVPLQNQMMKVVVEGLRRASIERFEERNGTHVSDPTANDTASKDTAEASQHTDTKTTPPFLVTVTPLSFDTPSLHHNTLAEMSDRLVRRFKVFVRLSGRMGDDVLRELEMCKQLGAQCDHIGARAPLSPLDKQKILVTNAIDERFECVMDILDTAIERLKRHDSARSQGGKNSKRANLEALQAEFQAEHDELVDTLAKKKLPKQARDRADRELKKLKQLSMMSSEAGVVRTYLDWMSRLPWGEKTEVVHDLARASNVLDDDHYGLTKVKERIIEHLCVQALVEQPRAPVLCLVGPPGVGKTSLARSIARATGREYVRVSLGGVRDESEIRGHRRTYIGAMPGRLIAGLARAGTSNPVMLLDEIDKMSSDFRGDPGAALLEVLDREQNQSFNDHYLDLDYDLSEVFFICTANSLSTISAPLRDRMEIIKLSGYTDAEKLAIASRYLIPRQLHEAGLVESQEASTKIRFTDDAIETLVDRYTREAGVRRLEQTIATCMRKAAVELLKKDEAKHSTLKRSTLKNDTVPKNGTLNSTPDEAAAEVSENTKDTQSTLDERRQRVRKRALTINAKRVREFMGPPTYRRNTPDDTSKVGVTNGLAYTQVGGEVLLTEVVLTPGKGKLNLTGRLGEVMRESAQAAMTYVRSRATRLGLAGDFYDRLDVHVHVPQGATPKDGPSAGITIATSLISALTNLPVRADTAMTGEITLRGRVMPIGGFKEKVLAAHRMGLSRIIAPSDNEKDLEDIPDDVQSQMRFFFVEDVDTVLHEALDVPDVASVFQEFEAADPVDVFDRREKMAVH